MGKRGPVPQKTFLKALSGNLPLTKNNLGQGQTENINPPDAPDSLSPEEKEIWDKTVELLKPLKILERIDAAVLSAYCCNYVRWKTAEREIQILSEDNNPSRGLLSIGAAGGFIINPLVTISRRCQADMVYYAAQLGMTPAARLRIQVAKIVPEENPFERLKDGKKQLDAKGKELRQIGYVKNQQK